MVFKNFQEKVDYIKSGKFSAVENVMDFGKKISEVNSNLNIFLHLNNEAIARAKIIDARIKSGDDVGKLAGLCFAVKSCISVKGLETNCASKVLEGYVSPFNATVINKLLAEDAIIIGMANMDEFACGWSGETSAFGPTKNPRNEELVPGGSSSGSAAAVAAGLCDFALGSDTGGSIRVPASHCGVVGLKPSYGSVSRYGLIDMCMSFDCIGPLTHCVEDSKMIFDIVKGQDNFDCTSCDEVFDGVRKKVIGLVETQRGHNNLELESNGFCDPKIVEMVNEKAESFAKDNGYEIKKVKLPLDISIETYYIIVYCEFFSGTRKFDGRRFGKNIDKFGGPEVLRRILGGMEITQAEFEGEYYHEALRAREKIKNDFKKIFEDCDFLILPTVPRGAHKIGEEVSLVDMMNYDVLTCLVNIAGLPAVSVPGLRLDGKEIGLQIIGQHFDEELILDVGSKILN